MQSQPPPYETQGQPGPYPGQGHAGHPGHPGPGQGTPVSAGYPPSNGPHGPVGPGGYSAPGGYADPAGPPGDPGWNGDQGRGAPRGWQPAAGQAQNGYPDYGYPSADGYGQTVNGGEYAYVISDNGPRSARPAGPREPQPAPAAAPRRRTREERMQARPTGETRSITAGRADAARAANPPANAAASSAYGPDDPAYGPPAPGWSHQDRPIGDVRGAGQPGAAEPVRAAEPGRAPAKADQVIAEPASVEQLKADQLKPEQLKAERLAAERLEAERLEAERLKAEPLKTDQLSAEQAEPDHAEPEQAATSPAPAKGPQVVRGPFEPLVEHGGRAAGAPSLPADLPATDAEGRPYEFPGLDDSEPAGSADAALDRLWELHATAAAVAPQSLDAHFDQLLERQRRLISEYINESEGPSAAAGASGEDSLVGFGGDFRGTR